MIKKCPSKVGRESLNFLLVDIIGVTMMKYPEYSNRFISIHFGKEIPYVGIALGTEKVRQRIKQ